MHQDDETPLVLQYWAIASAKLGPCLSLGAGAASTASLLRQVYTSPLDISCRRATSVGKPQVRTPPSVSAAAVSRSNAGGVQAPKTP